MASILTTLLNKKVQRISTPAQEIRDMLAAMGDSLMAAPMQRFLPHTALASPIFVNGSNGVNTNDGLTRDKPLLTLTAAIAKQTDENKHLYIFVERFYQPTGETWPIALNKDNVHIIGMGTPSGTWTFMKPTGSTPAMTISADRCEIAGFEIGGGTNDGAVEFTAAWGTLIHDCWFGVTGTTAGQDGIRVASSASYLTVYGCYFGQALTRDGIRIEGAAVRGMLGLRGYPSNMFRGVPGVGIQIIGQVPYGGVYDNLFAMPSDTKGKAITYSNTGANHTHFDGNRGCYGSTSGSSNPFLDTSQAPGNHWGVNYDGELATLPATS